MKKENQVVSLDLAKKMKELGFEQESYFVWHGDLGKDNFSIEHYQDPQNYPGTMYSAYTVAEIAEFVKKHKKAFDGIENENLPNELKFLDDDFKNFARIFVPDYLAKMLCYLKENKLI
jgi:ascorbate-specific PTS system EIIC-type component UlaA